MGLQVQPHPRTNGKPAPGDGDDPNDLNTLARQTLAGVKANVLPPEPFPSGFDLSALVSPSRSSHPPARRADEDTDGKIDLRAAAASARASQPRPVAPRRSVVELNPSPIPAGASLLPKPTLVGPAPASATAAELDRELDALIQARSFAPGPRLAASVAQLLAAARQAPTWSWVLAGGLALAAGLGAALSDDAADAPSATLAASGTTPELASAAPSLPAGVTGVASAAARTRAQRGTARHGRSAWAADRRARTAGQPESDAAEVAASTESALTAGPTDADPRALDVLLDRAIGGSGNAIGAARPAAPSKARSTLPDSPARDAVARAFAEVQPRIRFCAGGRSGVANASVVFKRDGRVNSARISGAPFSRTAAGRCMESVLRGARLPPFQQPTFRVKYPFQL